MALSRNKLEKARKPPKSLVSPISSTVAREKNLTEGEPGARGTMKRELFFGGCCPTQEASIKRVGALPKVCPA